MRLFLDTVDIEVLRELSKTGLIDGVTTNPSLVAKSGRDFLKTLSEICEIVAGPVSAEVTATDSETMIKQGEKLAKIAPQITIKLPLDFEGLKAVRHFSEKEIMTNVTLCFSVGQALLAAKAGASFVSPFIGRLEDHGADGLTLIENIRTVYDNYGFETEILAASVRSKDHVETVAILGADCATLPPQIFRDLIKHSLTDQGLASFTKDWTATGQSIL